MRFACLVLPVLVLLACGDDSAERASTAAPAGGSSVGTNVGAGGAGASVGTGGAGAATVGGGGDAGAGGAGGMPAFDSLAVVFPPSQASLDVDDVLIVRGIVSPASSVDSVSVAGVVATSDD